MYEFILDVLVSRLSFHIKSWVLIKRVGFIKIFNILVVFLYESIRDRFSKGRKETFDDFLHEVLLFPHLFLSPRSFTLDRVFPFSYCHFPLGSYRPDPVSIRSDPDQSPRSSLPGLFYFVYLSTTPIYAISLVGCGPLLTS